jgi:hypothetical protein
MLSEMPEDRTACADALDRIGEPDRQGLLAEGLSFIAEVRKWLRAANRMLPLGLQGKSCITQDEPDAGLCF